MQAKQVITVTNLNLAIKNSLETNPLFKRVFVKGELSNVTLHKASGHIYFTLKDNDSQISAMMFNWQARSLNFEPKEGIKVIVDADVSVYTIRGTYSLNVLRMTQDGVGDLFLQYEKLKKQYASLGYFDEKHKKAIPSFASIIGVVTSPTGAVIEDIRHTVGRRFPLTRVLLYPALVQGEGAKASIVSQIKKANQEKKVDVLIVGRGGGAIEDLWAFNEKEVIDAIFYSEIPIITAIGHETDYTISDFVSSKRAPTPTAAAELATPDQNNVYQIIANYRSAVDLNFTNKIKDCQKQLLFVERRLDVSSPINRLDQSKKVLDDIWIKTFVAYANYLKHQNHHVVALTSRLINPTVRINGLENHLKILNGNLHRLFINQLQDRALRLKHLRQQLINLNPLNIMDRGFALVMKDQNIITSITQIQRFDEINLLLKDGSAKATIKDIKERNEHGST